MDKIKGLIDAPFTPFYENGEVNYEPIEDYAKLLVKNGLKRRIHQWFFRRRLYADRGRTHEIGREMDGSSSGRL